MLKKLTNLEVGYCNVIIDNYNKNLYKVKFFGDVKFYLNAIKNIYDFEVFC